MKRLIVICTVIVLVLYVSGCGKADKSEVSSAQSIQEQTATETDAADTDNAFSAAETESAQNEKKGNDILIVYFSASNMNDTDAVTSATPLIDGTSSVEWIANIIREETGADVVKIVPTEDYPLSYNDVTDAAKKEADNEVHLSIQPLDVDPTAYKTVFIGYPMWWYRMPMVLETFFDTYDFSGVTIIPFDTHEGSRDGGTYDMIRDREPNATVLDGIAIRGGDAGEDSARDDIRNWLDGLNLN